MTSWDVIVSLDTRYKILEKIGSGSFATVYRARDTELGREVAIKQLHQEFVDDPQRLERFWQEAQLLASLQHPNIVTIFDIVRERGWLVLELMQGSLAERLAGKQIDLRALRATLAHVLRALKYLHAQGIIHGDIKPGNLMIDARRRVKLGDFGLACRVATVDGSLLKGTTKYMAPETVSDDFGDVGPASDLYSLGFSAYDLMCGPNFEELFPGLNAKGRNQQVAWMMWHAAPDRRLPEVGRVLEGVPPDLAKVVQKLTQKDQALRYKSADEALSDLQVDLKLVGGQTGEVVSDDAGGDSSRRTYMAAAALGVSVLMSAALLFWPSGKPGPVQASKVRGLIREVADDKNEFVVQDLNTGALEPFKVPRKQKIFLLNEKRNILLRELKSGDHVEIDVDKDHRDMVVDMIVDRPVPTTGTLKELMLNENRLVLSMEEGSTRDDLPVRVPDSATLKLNGQTVKLRDLQHGDRLEITHLSEPGENRGRVLNSLSARRTVTTVGAVASYEADQAILSVQVGQGATASSIKLPIAKDCSITLNGAATYENIPLTADALKVGDRVSVQHDTEITAIAATRSLQFTGVVQAVDLASDQLTISLSTGERHTLTVGPMCEITLALDRVKLMDLRPYDNVHVAYTEGADATLVATTIDARRPVQNDRWTVVLGTQSYLDSSLTPLKTALSDARLVQTALLSRYAVSDRHGALIVDGTLKDWERQLNETFSSAVPNSQVLIYVTGHAYLGDDEVVYIAPKDFKFDNMAANGLSLDWLAGKLNDCPSKDKLLILDVSPDGTGKDLKRQPAGKQLLATLKTPLKSTTTIIACDDGQQSRVWDEKRHGLFAWSLAEAIQGAADLDRDLHLTPQELFAYLKQQSELAPNRVAVEQTPLLIEPQPE